MIAGLVAVAAAIAACDATGTEASGTTYHVVAGGFAPGRGPDGNSIFFDAPEGLIFIDTGRHPEHQETLLAFAKDRGQPIAAIVNTHWHLDHSGGNDESHAIHGVARGVQQPARLRGKRFFEGHLHRRLAPRRG